jgi:hypothetical protein
MVGGMPEFAELAVIKTRWYARRAPARHAHDEETIS